MKWFGLLISLLLARHGNGFATPAFRSSMMSEGITHAPDTNTRLHATRKEQVVGAAASLLAGWALATQVAFADPFATTTTSQPQAPLQPTTIVTSIGFGNVETLDFSLPSYDDAASSGSVKPKANAPSFNPFGDFEPSIVSGGDNNNSNAAKQEEEEAKAAAAEEAKAAAEAKKAAAKAENEARKAAQKAEAEARRAAEKIEREARQAEEKAAAAAAKAAAEASSSAAANVPDVPEIKLPSFEAPDVKLPDFNFKAPDIKVPDFKTPDIKVPDFNAPDIKVPDFKFSMPKMDLPSTGGGGGGAVAVPKVDLPDVKLPTVNLPKVPNPFASSATSDQDKASLADPQEIRDERARAARLAYLDADKEAKDAEAAAKAVREAANEKKKLAGKAKDLACETRPGGKVICLRNPFNSGF